MKGEARGEETAYSPHYSDYKKSRNDIERHTFASGNVQEEFDHEDHAQEQRFQQTFGLTVPESPVFHTHRYIDPMHFRLTCFLTCSFAIQACFHASCCDAYQ